ncbi:MAG TPA: FAD-dependent oxidoreductase, partial [Deferrisomatales bacterium]|nr:FAD-dependent oxidoreductase [Deferrisomatales bacterium]
MKQYWDCSLCRIEDKGKALRCRRCYGRLRGRDRLLHEIGRQRKTGPRAALLSALAAGAGQMLGGRWSTGIALAALIPLAIGLVIAGWGGFTYGHVFLAGGAGFVLVVAYLDARIGPQRKRPPCQETCPAGVAIPDYLQLLLDEEPQQGYSLIRSRIPLVGVIGRICPHPCETACLRGIDGEPVSINGCKRHLADLQRERSRVHAEQQRAVVDLRGGELSVGVVGSGPAGVACAYYLSVLGAAVTVYEADSVIGGRLATTIPDYRLPANILDEELEALRDGGVVFNPNTRVGPGGVPLAELRQDHDALFLAVGAEQAVSIAVPGGEGLRDFQALLRAAKLGHPVELGRRVVVIGGGNAAMDVSRTALRCGAEEVHLLYRRDRDQMPARADEVEEAAREGVQFHFLADLAEVLTRDGAVCGVRVQQMELGAPDASGRPRPLAVRGQIRELPADTVIPALGQEVGGSIFDDPALAGLRRELDGGVWVDPVYQRTNLAGIYAGGDAVSGAATAVQAMAHGRRAALGIFGDLAAAAVPASRLVDRLQRRPFRGHSETPQARIREEMPQLTLRARRGSFREVEEGFQQEGA